MHPLVRAAGRKGELPGWARCAPDRRGHLERVARLMEEWGERRGVTGNDLVRWRAAAVLHDALRDADLEELTPWVGDGDGDPDRAWPSATLHGPACAARLREEGVDDDPLLRSIRYHTSGHAAFGDLGDHLYLADYLEPGRDFQPEKRRALRKRVPDDARRVLLSVIRSRLEHLLTVPRAILPETVAYWNARLEEQAEESARRSGR